MPDRARALRLSAPRLDDTQDVTLGSNPVGASGAWDAARAEELPVHGGTASIELPAGSAALVTFHLGGTMRRLRHGRREG